MKFESFDLIDSYYQLPMKNDDAFDTRNCQIECQNEFRVVEIVCMMLFQKSLFSPKMERNDRKWDICSWQWRSTGGWGCCCYPCQNCFTCLSGTASLVYNNFFNKVLFWFLFNQVHGLINRILEVLFEVLFCVLIGNLLQESVILVP